MMFYLQSESPSVSELNALSVYLLVCLCFVVFALIQFAIVTFKNRRLASLLNGKNKTKKKQRLDRIGSVRKKQGDKSYDEVVFLRSEIQNPQKEGKQANVDDGKSKEDENKRDNGSNDPIIFCLFLAGFVLFNFFYLNHYYEKRCE